MNRHLILAMILAAAASPSICGAQELGVPPGWEIGVDAIYQLPQDIEFEGGTHFGPPRRTDITGILETIMPRLNGTFDLASGPLVPYLSAGVGWAWMDSHTPTGQVPAGCWLDQKTWVELPNATSTPGLDRLTVSFSHR